MLMDIKRPDPARNTVKPMKKTSMRCWRTVIAVHRQIGPQPKLIPLTVFRVRPLALLRARRERPTGRHTSQKGDELAPWRTQMWVMTYRSDNGERAAGVAR
jgi:hypothetical protein